MQVGAFGVSSPNSLPHLLMWGSISAPLGVKLKTYPLYAVPKSMAMIKSSIVKTGPTSQEEENSQNEQQSLWIYCFSSCKPRPLFLFHFVFLHSFLTSLSLYKTSNDRMCKTDISYYLLWKFIREHRRCLEVKSLHPSVSSMVHLWFHCAVHDSQQTIFSAKAGPKYTGGGLIVTKARLTDSADIVHCYYKMCKVMKNKATALWPCLSELKLGKENNV